MSGLVDNARAIAALLQPLTGERATGQLRITPPAGGGNVLLAPGYYVWPVVDGQVEPQWLYKLAKNPAREDGCWDVPEAGAVCAAYSNIGGIRHNLPAGTTFRSELPEFATLDIVAEGDFTGATTSTEKDAVKLVASYESFSGPVLAVDMSRSALSVFPSIVVTWEAMYPADGAATSATRRGTHVGRGRSLYKWDYTISIITERMEGDQYRRDEGSAILDRVLSLLSNRTSVDGQPLSNPGGVQIISASPDAPPQAEFRRYNIYSVAVSITSTIQTEDSRTYWPWLLAVMDAVKNEAAGTEQSIAVVDGVVVQMIQE